MGGVGKTQLAAHHARTAWQRGEIDVLVWITASSRGAITARYAQAAVELLGSNPADPIAAAKEFLAWLEPKPQPRPCRWLVVLDDISDPQHVKGLWPPNSRYGRTVATTRRKDAALTADGRCLVEIELFTDAQALAYLRSALAAHTRAEPERELSALAADLGNLPLALSQAAAYLIDAGISCATYRDLLSDRSRSLVNAAPDVLPDDQSHSMAAAWRLSVEHAERLHPAGLARAMLQLASTMTPNGIPECVLTSPPAVDYLAGHRARGKDVHAERTTSSEEARATLRVLHRLSLIEHSLDTPHPLVRVHQLIQRTTRESLSGPGHMEAVRSAADSLVSTWGTFRDDGAKTGDFLASAESVLKNARDDLWDPVPHPLLFHFGASLGADGQLEAAVDHYRLLAEVSNRRLGANSRHTLAIRHNLAYWQWRADDLDGAATAALGLIDDAQRALGSADQIVLATRRVHANIRGQSGNKAYAIAELEKIHEEAARILGASNDFTLDVRHNLTYWQGQVGNSSKAISGLKEVLSDRLQGISVDRMTQGEFSALLRTLTSLIEQRGTAGDATWAVEQFTTTIEELGKLLGKDHETVQSLRVSLAWWRGRSGDIAGAIRDYTSLLAEEPELEPHHPHIRPLLHNLAYWKGKSGDLAGAIAILAELLRSELQTLGPKHPDVRLTRLLLTQFYWADTVVRLDLP